MISKSVVEKAESARVPAQYSISYDQALELYNHFGNGMKAGLMLFRLGYTQGMKAAKAEMRKAGKAVCRE